MIVVVGICECWCKAARLQQLRRIKPKEQHTISSCKRFKTINIVVEPTCRTAVAVTQQSLCLVLLGWKKKKQQSSDMSQPCGTCCKIISTMTRCKRKCKLRKSSVKEHLRLQQAVLQHMLLRCFQQCSIFSPCRRKVPIYSRLTLMV